MFSFQIVISLIFVIIHILPATNLRKSENREKRIHPIKIFNSFWFDCISEWLHAKINTPYLYIVLQLEQMFYDFGSSTTFVNE